MTTKDLAATAPRLFKGTAGDDALIGSSLADNIFGLEGNDDLQGGGGNDLVDGGIGADVMAGGEGDDVYVVDNARDKVVELAGEGIDLVQTVKRIFTLPDNVENLTFTNRGHHIGNGNALANVMQGNFGIDLLYGNKGDDQLFGAEGRDRLYGGNGNDILDGGTSADFMVGGKGRDTYYVDNVRDRAIEGRGQGIDKVFSTVSFTLPSNVELLTLTGDKAVKAIGNASANVLNGNSIANVLSGLDGRDVLDGGLGNDTLTGGAGSDVFLFSTRPSGVGNFDTVTDFSHAEGDHFQLSMAVFTGFDGEGRMSGSELYAGHGFTKAHDDNDRIIYDKDTGFLYYDADGLGGRATVHFATVALGTQLFASDFHIVV